jgi:hypothetical protein
MNLIQKFSMKYLETEFNSKHIKKVICHEQIGFILGMQGHFNLCKSKTIQCIIIINDKNHKIISIDAEKNFDIIQYPS